MCLRPGQTGLSKSRPSLSKSIRKKDWPASLWKRYWPAVDIAWTDALAHLILQSCILQNKTPCSQEEFTQELHEIAETYFEDELLIEGEFLSEQRMLDDGLSETPHCINLLCIRLH